MNQEFECEVRKRSYFEAYREYLTEEKNIKQNLENKQALKGKKINPNSSKEKKNQKRLIKRKEKEDLPSNLTKSEKAGFSSLKERTKAGEICIAQTDKSGRLAIMTSEQYLLAGEKHTKKDKEISWKEVKNLQKHVNNNVWWLAEIIGYSKEKNKARMMENLIDHGMEVPSMKILIKDHKQWSFESGNVLPSRPVVNGRAGFNTHLSEVLSTILEPIALEMSGAEVNSTEETLATFENINKKIIEDPGWKMYNSLPNILEPNSLETNDRQAATSTNKQDARQIDALSYHSFNVSGQTENGAQEENDLTKTPNENDASLVDTLVDLALNKEIPKAPPTTSSIKNYFKPVKKEETNVDLSKLYENLEKSLKEKARKTELMGEKIKGFIAATSFWKKKEKENSKNPRRSRHDSTGKERIPLQDTSTPPLLLGGDVVTLYPSLDCITTSELAAQSVRDTKLQFGGINYDRLSVFLTLTLGAQILNNLGLHHVILERNGDSRAESLSAKSNKDLTGWKTGTKWYSDSDKREMVAILVQICTIILMNSHVYSFGGKLFIQSEGVGIGLRASACLARITMCLWDTRWAREQYNLGLSTLLFIRYVDDLRIYLNTINRGWFWEDEQWIFDAERGEKDERTPEARTREEINKSFNGIFDCLNFTTETQNDFQQGTLPTLDVQTKTSSEGIIDFRHFTKEMASNTVLEATTALSKSTIFSALRQDLIRRLLNTRRETDWSTRISIIEDYTQLLANSGHKYAFAKAVILQAITKYESMIERANLPPTDKKYIPLYRARTFDQPARKILKYITPLIWYTGENLKDPYRHQWKKKIKRSFNRKEREERKRMDWKRREVVKKKRRRTTTAIFIPSTERSLLMKIVSEKEEKLAEQSSWTVKILEKSGQPIINLLQPKFSIKLGCPEGKNGCGVCKKGDGILCSRKNLVYQATCDICSEERKKRLTTPLHTSSPKKDKKNPGTNCPFSLQADLSVIELKERKEEAGITVYQDLVEHGVMVSDKVTPTVEKTKKCSVTGRLKVPLEGHEDISDKSEEILGESSLILTDDESTSSAQLSKEDVPKSHKQVSDDNTCAEEKKKMYSVTELLMDPQEGHEEISDTSEEMMGESSFILTPDENTSSAQLSKEVVPNSHNQKKDIIKTIKMMPYENISSAQLVEKEASNSASLERGSIKVLEPTSHKNTSNTLLNKEESPNTKTMEKTDLITTIIKDQDKDNQVYVGETARTLRQRATEHLNCCKRWGKKSFIIRHWMLEHGSDTVPPQFSFSIVKTFKEPLSRQIMEAIMILNTGTLNLKNEFGANHICRLESKRAGWDDERERKKQELADSKIESDLKEFVKIMSSVYNHKSSPIPDTNQLNISRYIDDPKKRKSSISSDRGWKRRRMEQKASSTPIATHRAGDKEMNEDADLISPIPQVGDILVNSLWERSSNNTDSTGGTLELRREKTNVSDPLRQMIIGSKKDKGNNSSREFAIEFLCLEDAAYRRGILRPLQPPNRHLDWLDIEGLASRMLREVNINEWSTLSFPEKDGGSLPRPRMTPQSLNNDNSTETAKTDTPNCLVTQETNQTPKRKLSPTEITPVGKGRKRSTAVYNSPVLRERLEMAEIIPRNEAQEAPDLISGIGRLLPRATAEPEQHGTSIEIKRQISKPQPLSRLILTPRFRGRASSEANTRPKNGGSRRERKRTNSTAGNFTSPRGQSKITDIFKLQQRKDAEKEEKLQ